MRRTGHDFAEVHVFRELPAGEREQHDRGSYPLRAVGVKNGGSRYECGYLLRTKK